MRIKNIHLLLLFVLAFTACHTARKVPEAQVGNTGFSFFVLGDWGHKGGDAQAPVANEMIAQSKLHHPDLVLAVGDNFYETGVESIYDEHWQLSYENIYRELTKKCPWYAALGNHDYSGSIDAEINYHQVNPNWNMPAPYYTFVKTTRDKQKIRFIVIDTNPYADAYYTDPRYKNRIVQQDSALQTRWLKEVLANAKEPWKIVVGHHPVYCVKPKPGETASLKRTMEPIFRQYHVQAYICGHDHIMQYFHPADGHTGYIISGAGGKSRKAVSDSNTLFSQGVPAFTMATISGHQLKFQFVDTSGQVIYQDSISRND